MRFSNEAGNPPPEGWQPTGSSNQAGSPVQLAIAHVNELDHDIWSLIFQLVASGANPQPGAVRVAAHACKTMHIGSQHAMPWLVGNIKHKLESSQNETPAHRDRRELTALGFGAVRHVLDWLTPLQPSICLAATSLLQGFTTSQDSIITSPLSSPLGLDWTRVPSIGRRIGTGRQGFGRTLGPAAMTALVRALEQSLR